MSPTSSSKRAIRRSTPGSTTTARWRLTSTWSSLLAGVEARAAGSGPSGAPPPLDPRRSGGRSQAGSRLLVAQRLVRDQRDRNRRDEGERDDSVDACCDGDQRSAGGRGKAAPGVDASNASVADRVVAEEIERDASAERKGGNGLERVLHVRDDLLRAERDQDDP